MQQSLDPSESQRDTVNTLDGRPFEGVLGISPRCFARLQQGKGSALQVARHPFVVLHAQLHWIPLGSTSSCFDSKASHRRSIPSLAVQSSGSVPCSSLTSLQRVIIFVFPVQDPNFLGSQRDIGVCGRVHACMRQCLCISFFPPNLN